MPGKGTNIKDKGKETWINPTGGYGDILMLSGVLKQCVDKNPQVKFNLVRRAIYSDLFNGHPAIKKIGYPPKDADIITTDYWLKEKLGSDIQRPYQILGRLFGLKTPLEEKLFLPGRYQEDRLLQDFIPHIGRKLIIIAPSSNSPRKMMDPDIWTDLVVKLKHNGFFVIQVGNKEDIYIRGAYSLLGLTTIHQLSSLLIKSSIIITVDNLIMHASHLVGKPAIAIWGPTDNKVYGYSEQVQIQCSTAHCDLRNKCLGPDFPDNYKMPCPLNIRHCMNGVSADVITEKVVNTFHT
jgi:ADP-heptose:LPS heptosyltransferase